jgi:hypothetical protein
MIHDRRACPLAVHPPRLRLSRGGEPGIGGREGNGIRRDGELVSCYGHATAARPTISTRSARVRDETCSSSSSIAAAIFLRPFRAMPLRGISYT